MNNPSTGASRAMRQVVASMLEECRCGGKCKKRKKRSVQEEGVDVSALSNLTGQAFSARKKCRAKGKKILKGGR